MFLLISTDGYSIDYTKYPTKDEAQEAMRTAYHDNEPEDWDENFEDMSYLENNNAILYDNGDNVYVWTIADLDKLP